MPAIHESIRAPEFRRGEWLNSPPLTMAQLRGRTVLVDFWDYTCLNCLRTLPYILEWSRRYRDNHFVVVGVHTPEFTFAKDPVYVREAIHRLGITYPVLHDADRYTWQAWMNRFWPAKYLVDAEGCLRFFQFGEGHYRELEQAIQQLLRRRTPGIALPALMPLIRVTDDPEAVCYRATRELYCGYQRGRLGNSQGQVDEVMRYSLPDDRMSDTIYLEGDWLYGTEAVTLSSDEGLIAVRYQAKEVNLVLQPPGTSAENVMVTIAQDAAPLPIEALGHDVTLKEGKTMVRIDVPRMYQLVNNPVFGQHLLRLQVHTPGVSAYAFTFVSDCSRETQSLDTAA